MGLRDDPFFFDLVAFLDQVKGAGGSRAFCDGDEVDFFGGADVTAIVLEVPSAGLTNNGGSTIRVWGRVHDNGAQPERMGIPVIATVLIPDGSEDAFNATAPAADLATWSADVEASLSALSGLDGSGYSDDKAAASAALLLPDVLTLDTSSTVGFVPGLNGRQPADDVIDFELFVVTGGLGAANEPAGRAMLDSDCVDANDVAFLDVFPYLAAPHAADADGGAAPAAAGGGAAGLPADGGGGAAGPPADGGGEGAPPEAGAEDPLGNFFNLVPNAGDLFPGGAELAPDLGDLPEGGRDLLDALAADDDAAALGDVE